MSHDLVSPVVSATLAAVSTQSAEDRPTGSRPAESVPQPANRALPNPSLRLDAGLGMVVLEFHDNSGNITASIPSQRLLEAYRTHTVPVPDNLSAVPTSPPADGGEGMPALFA